MIQRTNEYVKTDQRPHYGPRGNNDFIVMSLTEKVNAAALPWGNTEFQRRRLVPKLHLPGPLPLPT